MMITVQDDHCPGRSLSRTITVQDDRRGTGQKVWRLLGQPSHGTHAAEHVTVDLVAVDRFASGSGLRHRSVGAFGGRRYNRAVQAGGIARGASLTAWLAGAGR